VSVLFYGPSSYEPLFVGKVDLRAVSSEIVVVFSEDAANFHFFASAGPDSLGFVAAPPGSSLVLGVRGDSVVKAELFANDSSVSLDGRGAYVPKEL